MLKKTLSVFLALIMVVSVVPFFKTETSAAGIAITLDPGHGCGTGAAGAMDWGGLQEDHYNLTMAQNCKAQLEQYGFTVYMTRTSHSENPSYDQRVLTAVNSGSSAFVSIHNNSFSNANARGSAIFIVNPNYNYEMYSNSVNMANLIMSRLNNDVGTHKNTNPYYSNGDSVHPDGSVAEYYAVLWRAKRWSKGKYGSSQLNAAMIVEGVFQSNYSDVVNFLLKPEKVAAMGVAIANGIIDFYGGSVTPSAPTYVNNIDDTEGMTAKDSSNSHIQCTASVVHGNGFYMQGWSVHEDGISAFQGSLDGGAWTDIYSNFRQDVFNANPNHPNSSDKNAFNTTLDTSTIEPGVHTYKIRGVSKGGETYEIATYTIDVMPADGSTYMTVHSNALAPGGNFIVTAKGASTYAWVGLFGINETPGEVVSYYWYEMGTNEVTFDLLNGGDKGGVNDRGTPAPGNYKLVLFADTTSRMPIDEIAVTVVGEVQHAFDTTGPLTVAQGETFHISGWGASMDGMKGYAYSIDGVRASDYLTLNQRQDVIDHLTNCGFSTTINDTHAYAADISSASMTPGEHRVAVIGITNTDVEFDIGSIQVIVTAPAVIEKIEGNVTIDRDTDTNTSYIKDIDLNTTVEELLNMFTKDGCVIKDKDGNAATGKLGTGCTVELIVNGVVHETAIIIVKADLDGDAIATSKDVILAKLYRQSQTGGNVAKLASDFDGNGTVSATDLTSIAQAVSAN